MAIHSNQSRRHMGPKKNPPSVNRGLKQMAVPVKKTGAIKTLASVAVACVDVARALAGIYLFALYRQTVDKITRRPN